MSKRGTFTRSQVILLIENLLENPDAIMDCIQNEDPKNDAESLLESAEKSIDLRIWEIPDRNQYDKYTSTKFTSVCLLRAEYDEPIFVLRGKDPTAPGVVRKWANYNRVHELQPYEKIEGALNLSVEMETWRVGKYGK